MGICTTQPEKSFFAPFHALFDAEVTTSLPQLFDSYKQIVQFLKETNFFESPSQELKKAVQTYWSDQSHFDRSDSFLLVVESTHKLYPIMYANNKGSREWLLQACLKEHSFIRKISLEKLSYSNCEQNYVQFLYDCKVKDEKVVFPNQLADFMWRSHMQDNEAYYSNMNTIVGVVMHHWNEFEHKKQEEGQPQQQQIGSQHFHRIGANTKVFDAHKPPFHMNIKRIEHPSLGVYYGCTQCLSIGICFVCGKKRCFCGCQGCGPKKRYFLDE